MEERLLVLRKVLFIVLTFRSGKQSKPPAMDEILPNQKGNSIYRFILYMISPFKRSTAYI